MLLKSTQINTFDSMSTLRQFRGTVSVINGHKKHDDLADVRYQCQFSKFDRTVRKLIWCGPASGSVISVSDMSGDTDLSE